MFGKLFRGKNAVGLRASADVASAQPSSLGDGIPALSIDELICANTELIRRIRLSYGADRDSFDAQPGTLIRRYAEYVHLLPATPGNFFNAQGGLLRAGLEIGFYALQATDGQIFSGTSTITARHELEPRWRYATFIAGMCNELHRVLTHVIVTSEHGEVWPSYLLPLYRWLQRERLSRFHLRWIADAQEARSVAVFAVPLIVPAATLQYLSEGNSVIVPHMMACISGIPLLRGQNTISKLVARAEASVIERNLRRDAERKGQREQGSHLARHLVDAMRGLLTAHSGWGPNSDKSRVWYAEDGLYLLWPNAAIEIGRHLQADEIVGMPTDPQALIEILIDAGVFVPFDEQRLTWPICPPLAKGGKALEAAKFSSPDILFAALGNRPPPLPVVLAEPPRQRVEALPCGDAERAPMPTPTPTQWPDNAPDAAPAIASVPARARLALSAPMRLIGPLRQALTEIVDTLNDAHCARACDATPNGVFVPLAALETRRLDPAQAVRTLAECAMLAPGPKTISYRSGGEAKQGFVIQANFVPGLIEGMADADSTV